MRQVRDRGEILSRAMVDLLETFEAWDNQQFMASGAQEWREFFRALDRVNTAANTLDAGR
ncbi:MAG: hypothetical protein ACREIQ_10975 [Nitrospiria bacterium]